MTQGTQLSCLQGALHSKEVLEDHKTQQDIISPHLPKRNRHILE